MTVERGWRSQRHGAWAFAGRRSRRRFRASERLLARFHPPDHLARQREVRERALRLRLERKRAAFRATAPRRAGCCAGSPSGRACSPKCFSSSAATFSASVLRGSYIVRSKPLDLEPRIEVRAHFLHRLHEIGQPLERVVLALHRNQHRVGRAQAVQREQRQRRRTIEQDEIVIRRDRRRSPRASAAAPRRARPSTASRVRAGRPARPQRRRARDSPARCRSRPIGDCAARRRCADSPSSTW